MLACGSSPASFERLAPPRWRSRIRAAPTPVPGCTRRTAAGPWLTGWPVALTKSRSTQPSNLGAIAKTRRSSTSMRPTALIDLVERAHRRRLAPHAELLHLVDADLDLVAAGVRLLAFVDGDVVHPHRILLRHRRRVGQSHRIAVVEDLAFGLGARRRRRRGACRRDLRRPGRLRSRSPPVPGADADRQRRRPRPALPLPRFIDLLPTVARWPRDAPGHSTCAFSRSCLDLRICRCASSRVAKSTFPFS